MKYMEPSALEREVKNITETHRTAFLDDGPFDVGSDDEGGFLRKFDVVCLASHCVNMLCDVLESQIFVDLYCWHSCGTICRRLDLCCLVSSLEQSNCWNKRWKLPRAISALVSAR